MWNLLKRVRFSNIYRYDNENEYYSEIATQTLLKNQNGKEWDEFVKTFYQIKWRYFGVFLELQCLCFPN